MLKDRLRVLGNGRGWGCAHLRHRVEDILEALPLPQPQAHLPVTGERAEARAEGVAYPREAEDGRRLATESHHQPPHLAAPACDQGGH